MSTLERYRNRTRPSRIQTNLEYKDEEKFVLDRAQPEVLNKQVTQVCNILLNNIIEFYDIEATNTNAAITLDANVTKIRNIFI